MKLKWIVKFSYFLTLVLLDCFAYSGTNTYDLCKEHLDACEQVYCAPTQEEARNNIVTKLPGLLDAAKNSELEAKIQDEIAKAKKFLETRLMEPGEKIYYEHLVISLRTIEFGGEEPLRIYFGKNLLNENAMKVALEAKPEERIILLNKALEALKRDEQFQSQSPRERAKTMSDISIILKVLELFEKALFRVNDVTIRAKLIEDLDFAKVEDFSTFNRLAKEIGAVNAANILNVSRSDLKLSDLKDSTEEGTDLRNLEINYFHQHPDSIGATWEENLILEDRTGQLRRVLGRFTVKKRYSWDSFKYALSFEINVANNQFDIEAISSVNSPKLEMFVQSKTRNSEVQSTNMGVPSEVYFNDFSELPEYLQFIRSSFDNPEMD